MEQDRAEQKPSEFEWIYANSSLTHGPLPRLPVSYLLLTAKNWYLYHHRWLDGKLELIYDLIVIWIISLMVSHPDDRRSLYYRIFQSMLTSICLWYKYRFQFNSSAMQSLNNLNLNYNHHRTWALLEFPLAEASNFKCKFTNLTRMR